MAFIAKKHLSRRTFLKGAGVALALPLLDSMIPAATSSARTAAGEVRTRFGAIYVPHGATMEKWTPEKAGTGFEFSEILKPLEPYRQYVNVISDLSHPQAYGGGSATSNHNRSAAAFLSGAHGKEGPAAYLGVTMDQVLAKKIGQESPLPSLEMAIEGTTLACDGLSCAYRNTLSWQNATSPLPMQNSPQVIFERLFGDGADDAERRGRRNQSVSLLDSVLNEAGALQKTLPATDKNRMDQYLSDVREIERRIQKASQNLSPDLAVPDTPPVGVPGDFETHIKTLFDLQVLGWQADITRVTTLLMAKELSGATYPKSNVRDAFHTLSHHSNLKANKDRFAVLNQYHVSVFTYLLEKLKATPDGDGTLLDHSVMLYGSAISDGNEHNHNPLPIVLVGGASGKLKGGRHIRNPKDTTMSNLLLSLLNIYGVQTEKFGDSTGKLEI